MIGKRERNRLLLELWDAFHRKGCPVCGCGGDAALRFLRRVETRLREVLERRRGRPGALGFVKTVLTGRDGPCPETDPSSCSACRLERREERKTLAVVVDALSDPDFHRAFRDYLAALGCPVPGRAAQLFLCDRIFTHFEKEGNIQDLRGRPQDDRVRIRDILDRATSNYVATFLYRKVLERILQRDSLCVCVTFSDELSTLGEKTVSRVSTVDPDNPAVRTFKIVRQPAAG